MVDVEVLVCDDRVPMQGVVGELTFWNLEDHMLAEESVPANRCSTGTRDLWERVRNRRIPGEDLEWHLHIRYGVDPLRDREYRAEVVHNRFEFRDPIGRQARVKVVLESEFLHFDLGQAQTSRFRRPEGFSVLAEDFLAHRWTLIPEAHRRLCRDSGLRNTCRETGLEFRALIEPDPFNRVSNRAAHDHR